MKNKKKKQETEARTNTIPEGESPAEEKKKKAKKGSGKRKGTVLILAGVLLIMGALSLTSYNLWDNERAGKASEEVLQDLDEATADLEPSEPSVLPVQDPVSAEGAGGGTAEGSSPDSMKSLEVNGQEYIGTLEIPALGIRLPVMSGWSYQNLKISPCLYTGSYLTDDMVICGHNYAKHFSPIKRIGIGEDVYFTTIDKVVYHYTVSNRETVQPTDVKVMVENLKNAGENSKAERWDMTLFTCNPGGQTRCAVRCIRAGS